LIAGNPPALDLLAETKVQQALRDGIAAGRVRAAHDCSDGGIAVALAEMAIASGVGMVVNGSELEQLADRMDACWFGEASSRVLVAGPPTEIAAFQFECRSAEVLCTTIGMAGGDRIELGPSIAVKLSDASVRFESGLTNLS
jgi:phosphoribosylformylglycinamidine synthase subunit PurL